MLVRDFKSEYGNSYPQEFLDLLPDSCLNPNCGSATDISAILTGLKCSNPRCPDKVVKRITSIMSDLGVKDFGASRAADFVYKFGVKNPLSVFAYEPSDGTLGNSISEGVSKAIFDQISSKKKFSLWEYIRTAHLPFIQSSALILFGEYDDLSEAYEVIETGGVEYIREKLGIQKGEISTASSDIIVDDYSDLEVSIPTVSIRAIKIFEVLMTFKQDLFEFLSFVEILPLNSGDMIKLTAVCSEEVGQPFKTKADFYSTVNNLYPDIHIEFLKSINSDIDYLVWAGADGITDVRVTNKVTKVSGYNAKFESKKLAGTLKEGDHYIPIVTASAFLAIIEGMSRKQKDNI